jgi:hypothetical protein
MSSTFKDFEEEENVGTVSRIAIISKIGKITS